MTAPTDNFFDSINGALTPEQALQALSLEGKGDTGGKVSLEEVLIALRDDTRLLRELRGSYPAPDHQAGPSDSLYPRGFSGERFLEVIES